MKEKILQHEQQTLEKKISIIEGIIKELSQVDSNKDIDIQRDKINQKRVERYLQILETPYIGRLDYEDQFGSEVCYIGKFPVVKDHTKDIVYDWRSPIGDLYYGFHGGSGKEKIRSPLGQNEITVLLRRDLMIEKKQIKNFKDIVSETFRQQKKSSLKAEDETYVDDYLSDLLNVSSGKHQLKEIIASIQKDQNDLIRLDMSKPIIIQGAAGSGKSTIALHRISYLLYRFEKQLRAENILIIGPNEMFLSYIHNIVPELHLEKVSRSTFLSLAQMILPEMNTVPDLYLLLGNIVEKKLNLKNADFIGRYKGSIQYKEIIDKYLKKVLNEENLKFNAFSLNNKIKLLPSEISKRYRGYGHLPVGLRRRKLVESLETWVKEQIDRSIKHMEEEYEDLQFNWVKILPKDSELRRNLSENLEKTMKYRRKDLNDKFKKTWKEYKEKLPLIDTFSLYRNFLTKDILLALDNSLTEEQASLLCSGKSVSYEDIAALLYIEYQLNGFPLKYDYVVVDEAQDFSSFQVYVMRLLCKSMTLLGDMSQSIYSFTGMKDWEELIGNVFPQGEVNKLEMNISYRSTYEIMEAANRIMENARLSYPPIVPVNRHGEKIGVRKIDSEEELLNELQASIDHLLQKRYQKIAVIHKDLKRSAPLYKRLAQIYSNIQLIENATEPVNAEIVVIPSYLVKGLEFDAVIIPNANETNYSSEELDAKLLFVSVTRAHHDVQIFYHKQPSLLLKGLYEEEDTGELVEESIL
ncbi:HelD family protein [Priestia megaterium]|uniref:HelD family protein n=1 Tax=Priestia megaterium TaxID=1404 RepID=UPI002E1D37CB|nr:UvrD-helicase domain-containing protein [Priestia megaterium]MED4182093.1 UvrD-helicase domain-containing protein [Priestia megaterium]